MNWEAAGAASTPFIFLGLGLITGHYIRKFHKWVMKNADEKEKRARSTTQQ